MYAGAGEKSKSSGNFSASDLKGCHLATLRSWLPLNALEFVEKIPRSPLFTVATSTPGRELVTCHVTSTMGQVIRMVTMKRVHRVWVVDQNDGLQGLVSLTDIIAAVRSALITLRSSGSVTPTFTLIEFPKFSYICILEIFGKNNN